MNNGGPKWCGGGRCWYREMGGSDGGADIGVFHTHRNTVIRDILAFLLLRYARMERDCRLPCRCRCRAASSLSFSFSFYFIFFILFAVLIFVLRRDGDLEKFNLVPHGHPKI